MAKFVRPSGMGASGESSAQVSDPPSTNAGEDAAKEPEAEETSGEGDEEAESDEEQGEDAGGADESDEDLDEDEEGDAPESDDEPGEEDESDAGEDEPGSEAEQKDDAAELRKQLAEAEAKLAQAGQLIQQLRTPPAPQAPKEPSQVDQALAVIYELRDDPDEQKKRFEAFPASVRRDALLAYKANEERLASFARDPEGFLERHTSKAVAAAIQADREQQQQQAFLEEHHDLLSDKALVERLAKKAWSALAPGQGMTLAALRLAAADLRKEMALAKQSKREQKVAAKERDQRAVKRAQQDRGSRRADLGGQPGKKNPFTGKETSLREIRRKWKEAGGE